jgi:hypothetical protein
MAQGSGEVDAVTGSAPTPGEIRSRLEQTRAEMSDTIDAIQTRLSPARAIADARHSMAEATVGRLKSFGDRTRESCVVMLDKVRDNPLPAVLVATAAAGLLVYALQKSDGRRGLRKRFVRLTRREPDPATPETIEAW